MQYDLDGGVDTPGEFFCHPMYYPALLSTTVDTDVLIYVHPANDPLCRLPAGFLNIYTQREVICAITKVDLPDADFEATKAMLMDHGVSGLSSLSEKIALNSCRNWWIGSRRNKFQLMVSRE